MLLNKEKEAKEVKVTVEDNGIGMTKETILCQTPSLGKKPKRINKWKYNVIRAAILKILPEGGDGLLFSELPQRVKQNLSAEELGNLGSVNWYTTTVKLDLEVRGEIKRVQDSNPQRLLRC